MLYLKTVLVYFSESFTLSTEVFIEIEISVNSNAQLYSLMKYLTQDTAALVPS